MCMDETAGNVVRSQGIRKKGEGGTEASHQRWYHSGGGNVTDEEKEEGAVPAAPPPQQQQHGEEEEEWHGQQQQGHGQQQQGHGQQQQQGHGQQQQGHGQQQQGHGQQQQGHGQQQRHGKQQEQDTVALLDPIESVPTDASRYYGEHHLASSGDHAQKGGTERYGSQMIHVHASSVGWQEMGGDVVQRGDFGGRDAVLLGSDVVGAPQLLIDDLHIPPMHSGSVLMKTVEGEVGRWQHAKESAAKHREGEGQQEQQVHREEKEQLQEMQYTGNDTNDTMQTIRHDEPQRKPQSKRNITQQKKATRVKDPCAPVRPQSAYMCFLADYRKMKCGEKIHAIEMAKQGGLAWKQLDEKMKEKYVKQSEEDKKRYRRQMDEYQAKKVEENPKRPAGAYLFFMQEFKEQYVRSKDASETLDMTHVARLAGKEWKSMSKEERQPYEDLATEEKEAYRKKKMQRVASPRMEQPDIELEHRSHLEALKARVYQDLQSIDAILRGTGATLVGQTGHTVVGQAGVALVGQTGHTVVGQAGAALVGQTGHTVVGQTGHTLIGQAGAALGRQSGHNLEGPQLPSAPSLLLGARLAPPPHHRVITTGFSAPMTQSLNTVNQGGSMTTTHNPHAHSDLTPGSSVQGQQYPADQSELS